MKSEEQILELLAEVLRRQDQMQETLQVVNTRLGNVEENQQAHQQILRTLAVSQQKHQRELESITDLLDSSARMQRNPNRRLDRLENPNDLFISNYSFHDSHYPYPPRCR